jgi:phosphatidate cytidylyltransferase
MWNWHQFDTHKQRLVTGIIIVVPLVIALGFGPHWMLCLLVALAAGIGLWELQRMIFATPPSWLWLMVFMAGGLLLPLGASLGGFTGLHFALVASLLAGLIFILVFSPLDPSAINRLARFNFAWLYIPYLLSYALLVGRRANGTQWIFFILCVTAAADSAAFYCGRQFGRHKLYEAVSPKKTVEGTLGGLSASLVTGTLYGTIVLKGVGGGEIFVLSGILAMLGQLGDLIESMIKRISGRKDSSSLLPGHGGLLDRLDSLLFVMPATFFYLVWKDTRPF